MLNKVKYGTNIIDYFYKGVEFTQSHRSEEAISDSYDNCEPGLNKLSIMPIL